MQILNLSETAFSQLHELFCKKELYNMYYTYFCILLSTVAKWDKVMATNQ